LLDDIEQVLVDLPMARFGEPTLATSSGSGMIQHDFDGDIALINADRMYGKSDAQCCPVRVETAGMAIDGRH
jgi:hypothetical protein